MSNIGSTMLDTTITIRMMDTTIDITVINTVSMIIFDCEVEPCVDHQIEEESRLLKAGRPRHLLIIVLTTPLKLTLFCRIVLKQKNAMVFHL